MKSPMEPQEPKRAAKAGERVKKLETPPTPTPATPATPPPDETGLIAWLRRNTAAINLLVTATIGIAGAISALQSQQRQMSLARELEEFRQTQETARSEAEREARDRAERQAQLIREGQLMSSYLPVLFGTDPAQRALALQTLTATMPLTGGALLERLARQEGDPSVRDAARGALEGELGDIADRLRADGGGEDLDVWRSSADVVGRVVETASRSDEAAVQRNALEFLGAADRPALRAHQSAVEAMLTGLDIEALNERGVELVERIRRRLRVEVAAESLGPVSPEECMPGTVRPSRSGASEAARTRCAGSLDGQPVRRFGAENGALRWGVYLTNGNIVRCECQARSLEPTTE